MPFANGENVGAYRIVEKLGQGGMATVFKAYHPALDRYVAIKVMHPAFKEDLNFLARFQREARIVARLDHPHIVPIYDFAEHNEHPYLVMRFIEGETLKARLQRGTVETQDILRIARAVGEALTYAHGQGVLHRDIKPSNVLLTPDGGVYLTDFGLARMAEAGESTLSRDMMVGTPQYISPEQAKGVRALDARTDVYSFGVVLYEMLVGQAPFTADTPFAIVHDHIFTPLPLPRELRPDLPEPLERVLLKALAKDPDDRFQSVEELAGALEAALKPTPAPSPPETIAAPLPVVTGAPDGVEKPAPEKKPRKKKRRWPWAVAGVAVLICIMAVLCLAVSNGTKSRKAERLLESARIAREEGNPDSALDLYKQAVEADPHLIPAYAEASELFLKMGETDPATDVLMMGLEANPDNLDLHRRLAEVSALTGQWDEAQKGVDWLLHEIPEEALPHAYAALIVLAQGRPCEEAHPELDEALRLDQDLVWAHYGLALCHRQEGNIEAAHAELEFVLGQEDISPLLRARAEEMLGTLGMDAEEAIVWEFDALMSLTREIPHDGLREQLREILGQARRAWQEGNKEEAIHIIKETIIWVRENSDDLGEPAARRLIFKLIIITRLVSEP